MYRIYLLGAPRIYKDGELVRISRRKSLAILAYLAATGQSHSRDEMATLFYPDQDQSGARNNLRRDLFDLKSSLDDGILLLEGEQINLMHTAPTWVDISEFFGHVNHVRQHHPSQPAGRLSSICEDCRIRLTHATELYSADFLSGFHVAGSRQFEDWQFFQSENLRQNLSDVLQQIIQLHNERGEFENAITHGRRWVAHDPLNELAQRQLMSLYAHSGQQAAALRQYQECTERLRNELGVEPDTETTALYEAIRAHKFPDHLHGESNKDGPDQKRKIPSAVNHNLPPPEEKMAGRENELIWIANQLSNNPDCRMLTLLGPGGIGKTRLAVEAAYHLAEDSACPFCEGIFFVSLVSLSQSASIVLAIADALKLPLLPDPEKRTEQLLGYLHPKRLLLLLDNFEHLVNPQSIQLLTKILDFSPQVKLLITSRTRLNAHFEHILTLEGLSVPQSERDYIAAGVERLIAEYSAIQLFVQRARHIKPDFSITSTNLNPVVQICRMVEGMPLGIELAAAWLDVLSPLEIMTEISQCLDFLAVQWPDRPERQHSLRAVFDSSWRLLAENERSALMALTLFQGSFSREAAQAVSGASIQLMMSMHNKSWLQVLVNGRYQIHELLCQYANQQLQAEPGSWQDARERYCTYYATFLNRQVEPMRGSGQRAAFDSISIEFENIRLAWQWLVEGHQMELAVERMLPALYHYTVVRAKAFELTRLIDLGMGVMAKESNFINKPLILPIMQIARAGINNYGYSYGVNYFLLDPEQKKIIQEVWVKFGDIKSLKAMGFWGIILSHLSGLFKDEQIAVDRLQELIAYFREQKQHWNQAYTHSSLGRLLVENMITNINPNNIPAASENLSQALSIFKELGDKDASGSMMDNIALLYQYQSKYLEAIEQWQNAQKNMREGGDRTYSAYIYLSIADVYSHLGDHKAVFHNYQTASQELTELGLLIGSAHALSAESIYALRYSDIQHALRTRQESLLLYQEGGQASGMAWGSWEMGEISRVAGDLSTAMEWFAKAKSLFENLGDPTSPIFTQRGFGDIAQMRGDFAEAKRRFLESKQISDQTNHHWAHAYALCGLGKAEAASGELEAAQEHFFQAIRIAQSLDKKELVLIALAGYASVLASTGEYEQAVELGSMVIQHKFSWNETKAQMLALLQTIQSIPSEQFSAARERGRDLDIELAIKRFNLFTQ